MSTQHNPLMLGDYLAAVKLVMDELFEDTVWVVCELQSVSSKAGHYYFELTDSQRQATCRGVLWCNRASVLKIFEQKTGIGIQSGLKVLLCGRAVFHAQYGFSFQIYDIDPSYTIGALAHDYAQMKSKLKQSGLFWQNQRLPMPFDLQDILVVSPQNAAGLGDFQSEANRLEQAGVCRFYYHHATFQGNHAPLEIRQTMTQAYQQFVSQYHKSPDLLVLIRGGGAVGDLAYLNDYELAAMVCEFAVPVWVGIGHERDNTILDEVAHRSFDTPSKLIFGIQHAITSVWQSAYANFLAIYEASHRAIAQRKSSHALHLKTIKLLSLGYLAPQKRIHANLLLQIHQASKQQLEKQKHTTQALIHQHKNVFTVLEQHKAQLMHYHAIALGASPQKLLKKGYAIVKQDNKTISSIRDLSDGKSITIHLSDGIVIANICAIHQNPA